MMQQNDEQRPALALRWQQQQRGKLTFPIKAGKVSAFAATECPPWPRASPAGGLANWLAVRPDYVASSRGLTSKTRSESC
jgi:hypothetical protein